MSIALMTIAFKASLPTAQKFVLVALCDSANDQGECYPSVPTLADKCSMSARTVQAALAGLESAGFVRREFRKGRSTVYWLDPRNNCTPADAAPPQMLHHTPADSAPPPPQQPHPTPADAAPITVNEPKTKRVIGTRLPPDWIPSEADSAYAADKGVDARAETESFRDHWLADTTPKAVKADWAAAWRTWCRNSVKFAAQRGGNQPASDLKTIFERGKR
jgi:DNA-binding transcriptional MocR family regulator